MTLNEGLQIRLSFIPPGSYFVVNHSLFELEIQVLNFYFYQKFLEIAI